MFIGIQNNPSLGVSRGPADGLDKRCSGPQIALLIRVQNADQCAFRNIQALPQQVNADKHVKHAQAQIADNLDTFQRVHIRMHIAHLNAGFMHIFGQRLGHLLGQRGDQNAGARLCGRAAFGDDIINLCFGGADLTDRVNQAGRAHHLFCEHAACLLQLPASRRCRNINGLRAERFPFLKLQGPVIQAGRQPEPIIRQGGFPREIALIHGAYLRHGHMAFIDHQQGVFRQIFKQCRRRLTRAPARQIA